MADLDDEQFEARVREVLAEEMAEPERDWWLSFADETGFLGIAIVRGRGMLTATREARRQHCNPGGEVRGFPLLEDGEGLLLPRNRLLSRDEVERLGVRTVKAPPASGPCVLERRH